MSDVTADGRELLAFLDAARKTLEDLSALLRVSDSLMASEHWELAGGSYCNEGVSAALHIPSGWLPRDLIRFYRHPESRPNVLAVVSVTLGGRTDANIVRPLEEPLINAIWFDYATETADEHSSRINWYGWWPRYFPAVSHGHWKRQSVADLPTADREQNKYRFTTAWSMSEPLVRVTTADSIKELIVRPLLTSIGEKATAVSTKKS